MRMPGALNATLVKGGFKIRCRASSRPRPSPCRAWIGDDWYESTLLSLNSLYPYVSDQGLILVDDYATWDGCSRAVHEFLAWTTSVRRIQRYEGDVCVLTPPKFWF
jgi:O-methyltransferase